MPQTRANRGCTHATDHSSPLPKRWNAEFFKKSRRNRTITVPLFVDILQQNNVQRELQDVFLQYSEIGGSSWEVEQVRNFFRDARAIPDAKIWVDIRVKNAEAGDCRSRWLTSSQLAEVVAQQVRAHCSVVELV